MDLDWSKANYAHQYSSIIIKDLFVYKKADPKIIDTEYKFLMRLRNTGYVPNVRRINKEVLKIQKIPYTKITDKREWFSHYKKILNCLKSNNIKHGDLTSANIIPYKNKPYIIDFSESINLDDPHKITKRPEEDSFWLKRGMIYHWDFCNFPLFHNQRAPEMWEIIHKYLPHNMESLIDLGCGYADLSIRTFMTFDCFTILVDSNEDIIKEDQYNIGNIKRKRTIHHFEKLLHEEDIPYNVNFICSNILKFIKGNNIADVMFCCAVLPYFLDEEIEEILTYMSRNSKVSFIEMQYKDDGPGKLENDDATEKYLLKYFKKCQNIGKTYVEDRKKYRTIWRCYNED